MHNCETSLLGAEDSRIQIFLISGVPGVGKTTLSYELLKRFSTFRIIQETDLIREILRGYNEYLQERYCDCNHILIPDHTKIFTYEELKEQCTIMKNSIEQIVLRQIRKGIPSILNGVHIVPEILNSIAGNHRIKFINLYISSIDVLKKRLSNRDAKKYMPHLDVLFEANCELYKSTQKLCEENPNTFQNLDVTYLSIEQTIATALKCFG